MVRGMSPYLLPREDTRTSAGCRSFSRRGRLEGLEGNFFLASRLPTAAAEQIGCRYRRGTYTTKLSCGLNHLHCVDRDAQGLVLKVPSRSPLSFLVTSLAFSKTEFRHVSSPGLGESFAGKGKRCRFVTKKWPALAINTRFPLIMD